jgi:hypothetical protein
MSNVLKPYAEMRLKQTVINEFVLNNKLTAETFLDMMLDGQKPSNVVLDFPTDGVSTLSYMLKTYAIAFAVMVKEGKVSSRTLEDLNIGYYIQKAESKLKEDAENDPIY